MATALVAAAVAASGPAVDAAPADRLATLLGDRVAGEPTDCIDRLDINAVHLVAGGIVYEMKTGGVLYYNRPTSGATFVHDGVVLLVEFARPRLCQGDVVRTLNENSRRPTAGITLGAFVPYRRPVTP